MINCTMCNINGYFTSSLSQSLMYWIWLTTIGGKTENKDKHSSCSMMLSLAMPMMLIMLHLSLQTPS